MSLCAFCPFLSRNLSLWRVVAGTVGGGRSPAWYTRRGRRERRLAGQAQASGSPYRCGQARHRGQEGGDARVGAVDAVGAHVVGETCW